MTLTTPLQASFTATPPHPPPLRPPPPPSKNFDHTQIAVAPPSFNQSYRNLIEIFDIHSTLDWKRWI